MTTATHRLMLVGNWRALIGALLVFEVASIIVPAIGIWMMFRLFAG